MDDTWILWILLFGPAGFWWWWMLMDEDDD